MTHVASGQNVLLGKALNIVPFVSVDHMMKIVGKLGMETMLSGIADYIEQDFRRWPLFDKTPRVASHSKDGVIELDADQRWRSLRF